MAGQDDAGRYEGWIRKPFEDDPGQAFPGDMEPAERVTIERYELDHLLAVATVYAAAFTAEELVTLPQRLALQEVEVILAKYGRRY